LTVERLLDAVARDAGLSSRELAGRRRGVELAEARCVAAYIGSRFGGLSVRRVARQLGRDDSTFARSLAGLERRLDSDASFRARLDRIVESLRPDAATLLCIASKSASQG